MPTPSIQTLRADAQQVLNLDSISAVRSVVAATLANANAGTPLNPNLTTQQLWNEFYQIVTQPKSDIESIIANQLMKFLYAPPAPGGVGADGQVIFNDGGVLAGDPQFLWNKTTNLLTVTGNATITGDLTVDTSTLKVDSANNRVGIGTASPGYRFDVTTSPATSAIEGSRLTDSTRSIISGQTGATYSYLGIGANQNVIYTSGSRLDIVADTQSLFLRTGTAAYALLDSSGNLGLRVTPSAWNSGLRAIQVGYSAAIDSPTSVANTRWSNNSYVGAGGGFQYINNGVAQTYEQDNNGKHIWYNAPSGTAGNAITFTQAMTLDAGGNLLVGKTAANITTVGFQAPANGEISMGCTASANANTTLNVYSTGAANYRFYVGLGGTVFATNTTISAISDARLKENVQDIDVGLGAILALKPRKFDWKEGKGKNIKGDRGFIAQEFETVFPNLIDEWKDDAPAGEAPYKSVRQDLIPVLVKAIQELTARVQTLEIR